MSNLAPSSHFNDAIEALVLDWKGQDELFYHQRGIMTIAWYVGKVKSLVEIAEFRKKATKRQFIAAACQAYGIKERRIYEALEVYQRFVKPGDSVRDTSERIFLEAGGWSKALPAKPEKEVEPTCNHCPIHCKHE